MTRAVEAGVLGAAHDHRVEPVARHRLADQPVAPLDLVRRNRPRRLVVTAPTMPQPLSRVPRSSRAPASATPWRRPKLDDAAVQVVDLGLPPRLDVLQHRRLVAVRDVAAAPRSRSAPPDRSRARSPAPRRPPCPRRRAATRARRSGGCSQTAPCVRPVSAPSGFVAALKITLRHCGPRASATAFVGMPARVHASASRSTSASGAGLRLERAERRVALDVPLHDARARRASRPGTSCRGSRARTCAASTSSLPIPFWTVATQPSANACAVAAIARVGVHRLRRDDPEVARRQLGRVGRRAHPARRRRRRRSAAGRRG